MSKKSRKPIPVNQKENNKKLFIDMNEINLKKAYHKVTFKTGKYLTEKDRPRKKIWDDNE